MIRGVRYPTLKDVARHAGCSPAVVSTVVNGARGNTIVSEAMRERVRKAAAELGYHSNFASRSLVQQRTRTLGVYIPPSPWAGLGFSYDNMIMRGVEAASREHGYDLLLMNLAGSQTPDICFDKFAERRIDGLILIHVDEGGVWLRELLDLGRQVVAVDYSKPEPKLDAIVFDNEAVSRVAVEHLVALGHRKIGFIGSCRQPHNFDAGLRLKGFRQTMAALDLPVRPEWVFDERFLPQPIVPHDAVCQIEGEAAARHMINLGAAGPTAWIAYSDLVAVSVLPVLGAAGVSVPGDVSLVGVDDSEWCRMVSPQLTSVGHPLEEMGRRSVECLVARIEGGAGTPDGDETGLRFVFKPTLVARDSTAAVRC